MTKTRPGRWLIVGCGYVGTALGRMLMARQGATEVVGVRRHLPAEPQPFTLVAAACEAADFAAKLPAGDFDTVVYSVAAKSSDPAVYEQAYVHGAQALVRALKARQSTPARLLFTSSTAVFEANDGRTVDETTPCNPSGFRGVTMRRAEDVFLRSGWPAVVIRLGGIYGPGRVGFLQRVASGKTQLTHTPAYANRIHRDDCAGALMHLGSIDAPAAIYVGVDSAPVERNTVVRWVCSELGRAFPPVSDAPVEAGKRCENARLIASGYSFEYPTYREGYAPLLSGLGA